MIKYNDYLKMKEDLEDSLINSSFLRTVQKYGNEIMKYRNYINRGWEFIEEYKGNEIFKYEGLYAPYIGCHYGFRSIDDCKKRIDTPNVSYMPI